MPAWRACGHNAAHNAQLTAMPAKAVLIRRRFIRKPNIFPLT
jgi:hypothetical protein